MYSKLLWTCRYPYTLVSSSFCPRYETPFGICLQGNFTLAALTKFLAGSKLADRRLDLPKNPDPTRKSTLNQDMDQPQKSDTNKDPDLIKDWNKIWYQTQKLVLTWSGTQPNSRPDLTHTQELNLSLDFNLAQDSHETQDPILILAVSSLLG